MQLRNVSRILVARNESDDEVSEVVDICGDDQQMGASGSSGDSHIKPHPAQSMMIVK